MMENSEKCQDMQISMKHSQQNYHYVLANNFVFSSLTFVSLLGHCFITGKVQPDYQRVSHSPPSAPQEQVVYLLGLVLFLSLTLSSAASTLPRIPGYQGTKIIFLICFVELCVDNESADNSSAYKKELESIFSRLVIVRICEGQNPNLSSLL